MSTTSAFAQASSQGAPDVKAQPQVRQQVTNGKAQSKQNGASKKTVARTAAYFIDFRSRYALSYGHTFSVYGRLDAAGNVLESHVAGLHPATEDPTPWMIGHVIPVPSETGASDGDTEDQYISARYRILLSEEDYDKLVAYIKDRQANTPLWHAVFYNCNAFVADIARFMGLQTPYSTWLFPADFINTLREMNGGVERVVLSGR